MRLASHWFGLFPVHSPLLRESLFCFPFFQVIRCFSSLACLDEPMDSVRHRRHLPGGVAPFGDPRILVCNNYSWHIAVYCVLLRLLVSRYPPCALNSLTINFVRRFQDRNLVDTLVEYGLFFVLNMQFSGCGM